MWRVVLIILGLLWVMPSTAWAQSFYEREVQAERLSWTPFLPQETLNAAFPEEKAPEVQTSPDYRIVINLPARRLFLYESGRLIKKYPVAVGTRRYRTPVGPRFLKDVTWNPWWYPPPSDWAKNEKPTPPGPGNPLGRVKMSLGGDIYLHATNKESSVGRAASHGCMRMRGKDAMEIAWFFQRKFSDQTDEESLKAKYDKFRWSSFYVPLSRKIPVDVVYERVTLRDDAMEIHPDIYGRIGNLEDVVLNELSAVGIAPWEVDPTKLEDLKRLNKSTAVPIGDLL